MIALNKNLEMFKCYELTKFVSDFDQVCNNMHSLFRSFISRAFCQPCFSIKCESFLAESSEAVMILPLIYVKFLSNCIVCV